MLVTYFIKNVRLLGTSGRFVGPLLRDVRSRDLSSIKPIVSRLRGAFPLRQSREHLEKLTNSVKTMKSRNPKVKNLCEMLHL